MTATQIEDNAPLTNTNSWDTVFAVKIKDVNAAIKNNQASPTSMQQAMDEDGMVTASFGDWFVGDSGDGNLLHLNIPIVECEVVYNGKSSKLKEHLVAVAEVRLHFYDSVKNGGKEPPAAPSASINKNQDEAKQICLKVKHHKLHPDDEAVSAVSVDFGELPGMMMLQALLPDAIKKWLNANMQVFDHIFATVNLNQKAANGAFQWLMPTHTGYAFIRNENDPAESTLGILCMTEGRNYDTLVEELAYNAIPPQAAAGFLISQERLMDKLIMPSLPKAFPGLTTEDFVVDDGGTMLLLNVDGKSFTVMHENKEYQATLESFQLSLKDGKLSLHAQTKTTITPHIYAHSTQDHAYSIELFSKPDGSQSLQYVACSEPVILNSTSQDAGVGIGEMVASIIAGVMLAILTILTDGLVLVLVVIIGGLLVGLIASASEIVQLIGTNDAPNVDLLLLNFTDPIRWTDQKDFTLSSAGLNGPLQLGGNFKT